MSQYEIPHQFVITDGTTRVDITKPPFFIYAWTPPRAVYKGGGTYQDSPISDGRQLVQRRYENLTEQVRFAVAAYGPDNVIRRLEALGDLFEKAADYQQSDYATDPVWIEVLGRGETNIRYAKLISGSIPQDEYPFGQQFHKMGPGVRQAKTSTWLNQTMVIEHGLWQSVQPGTGTAVSISAVESYVIPYGFSEFIQNDTDDVDVNHGTSGFTNLMENPEFGDNGGNNKDAFLLFTGVDIPQGSTIEWAYIQLKAATSLSGTTVNALIEGHASDDAPAFPGYAGYVALTRTTASVAWSSVAAWTADTDYLTPDIGSIIEEIVGRSGWSSGNDLAIFIQDDSSSGSAYRNFYGAGNGVSAKLIYGIAENRGNVDSSGTREPTTAAEVFIANKSNVANITHIFVDDGGNFGQNLMETINGLVSLPFSLLPAVPATDDAIYFGIDTSLTDSGPFNNLIFDIGTAMVYTGSAALVWEYYDGGSWTALTSELSDNTDGGSGIFTVTGVNSVLLPQQSDWAATSINGVTGYWIRARVELSGGTITTVATQQNRNIYSVTWPYVEIQSTEIGGNIPAVFRGLLHGQADINASDDYATYDVFMGLRSMSRGENFNAYLNASDEQLPSGITTSVLGPQVTINSDPLGATGKSTLFSATAASYRVIITWSLDSTIAPEYLGRYAAYVRYAAQGAGTTWALKLDMRTLDQLTILWTGDEVTVSSATGPSGVTMNYAYLGELITPFSQIGEMTSEGFMIVLGATPNNTTDDIKIYDLVLIPVDEWFGYTGNALQSAFTQNGALTAKDTENYLDINPYAKRGYSILRSFSTDGPIVPWARRFASDPIMQVGKRQRIWTMQGWQMLNPQYSTPGGGFLEQVLAVQLQGVQRYRGMRGDV